MSVNVLTVHATHQWSDATNQPMTSNRSQHQARRKECDTHPYGNSSLRTPIARQVQRAAHLAGKQRVECREIERRRFIVAYREENNVLKPRKRAEHYREFVLLLWTRKSAQWTPAESAKGARASPHLCPKQREISLAAPTVDRRMRWRGGRCHARADRRAQLQWVNEANCSILFFFVRHLCIEVFRNIDIVQTREPLQHENREHKIKTI